MNFYKDHYDVVVIGGALAGLSSALTLSEQGKSVLVLEQNNLPGGLSASFVRGGVELEASPYQTVAGTKENRPRDGSFPDLNALGIDCLAVPELCHASLPGIEKTLHPGFETFAKEIDEVSPGSYEKVLRLLSLCKAVSDDVSVLPDGHLNRAALLLKHEALAKTAGYSALEVIETFALPRKAAELLSTCWFFAGSPLSDLPFTVWAVLMVDYVGSGTFVPKKLSYDIALRLAERAESNGVQIEYRQQVHKILVKNRQVYGVRTVRGDEIHADSVICSVSPVKCYTDMIEPLSELSTDAIKAVNSRKTGLTNFTVTLLLDRSAQALGIRDSNVFLGKTANTDAIFENCKTLGPYSFLSSVCPNLANPGCTPEGTCTLSITALPRPEGWCAVTADDYDRIKHQIARDMIEATGVFYGLNLFDHILEVVIETPMTVSRYTGAWNGSVFGFSHSRSDHILARLLHEEKERFFSGLEFAGVYGTFGSGMTQQMAGGCRAARAILEDMQKKEAAK